MPQSDFDKWIKLSGKLREEDVTRKAQLKDIAKFMKQFLPEPAVQRFERITPSVKRRESLPTAAAEMTPKKTKFKIDEDAEEELVSDLGEFTSPHLKPYLHNVTFLYKQYGIRREGDGRFMIW